MLHFRLSKIFWIEIEMTVGQRSSISRQGNAAIACSETPGPRPPPPRPGHATSRQHRRPRPGAPRGGWGNTPSPCWRGALPRADAAPLWSQHPSQEVESLNQPVKTAPATAMSSDASTSRGSGPGHGSPGGRGRGEAGGSHWGAVGTMGFEGCFFLF